MIFRRSSKPEAAPPSPDSSPQEKSSYKVKGVVFEEPAETRVIITTLQEGAGEATVQAGDSVTVNYVGRLMDGTRASPAPSTSRRRQPARAGSS